MNTYHSSACGSDQELPKSLWICICATNCNELFPHLMDSYLSLALPLTLSIPMRHAHHCIPITTASLCTKPFGHLWRCYPRDLDPGVLAHPVLLQGCQCLPHALQHAGLHAVMEQDALQVVVLVLEDARRPGPHVGGATQLQQHRLTLFVLGLDHNVTGALHIAVDLGEGEAALLLQPSDLLAHTHNLWVHQDALVARLLPPIRVEDHEPHVDPDLRRGQAHPVILVHDGNHLLGECHQGVVKHPHFGIDGP
mmetsp:Transcript_8729/g.18579  ORF Transcript_8729/g.18579 Transcript_8729/m.18579 type:complete len:252 (-) Transcript_8729:237-992(-)